MLHKFLHMLACVVSLKSNLLSSEQDSEESDRGHLPASRHPSWPIWALRIKTVRLRGGSPEVSLLLDFTAKAHDVLLNLHRLMWCNAPHALFFWSAFSEELLGMHETIQIYYKLNLEVPVRLVNINSIKRGLARDVSGSRSFSISSYRKDPFASSQVLKQCTTLPVPWLVCYRENYCSCKNLHPELLTLLCVNMTPWLVAFSVKT